MLKGKAREFYYDRVSGRNLQFQSMISQIQQHFETHERRQQMLQKWNMLTLSKFINQFPEKSVAQCFELLLDDMQKTQRGLAREYQSDSMIRDNLVNVCRDVKECAFACFKPSITCEALCADIRAAIGTSARIADKNNSSAYNMLEDDRCEILYTNRKYFGKLRSQNNNSYSRSKITHDSLNIRAESCFVCHKVGCCSTNHSSAKQTKATEEFKKRMRDRGASFNSTKLRQFIVEFEGICDNEDNEYEDTNDIEVLIADMVLNKANFEETDDTSISQYLTDYGEIDRCETNQAA
ncbi:hypothetical protein EPUL_005575, partial [Erysiphe pulchra]